MVEEIFFNAVGLIDFFPSHPLTHQGIFCSKRPTPTSFELPKFYKYPVRWNWILTKNTYRSKISFWESFFFLLIPVGTESGNASRSLTNRFNGPGMEKLQETSSGLAGVLAKNRQVRDIKRYQTAAHAQMAVNS